MNNILKIELNQLVEDYFILVKKISESSTKLIKFSESVNETFNLTIDEASEFKKLNFLHQFYNKSLVKIISKIELLYKVLKLNNENIEFDNFNEETLLGIVKSDPDVVVVVDGEVVIVDSDFKRILDEQLSKMTEEEYNFLKNQKNGKSK